jgi:hypothetical protein
LRAFGQGVDIDERGAALRVQVQARARAGLWIATRDVHTAR